MTDIRLRPLLHLALLACAAVTALGVVIDTQSPVRVIVALVALALLPGAAILALLPPVDAPAWFGLAVGLSLAVEALGALIMVWLSWWHPAGLALALGVGGAVVLVHDLRRHPFTWAGRWSGGRREIAVPLGLTGLGLSLWIASLGSVDLARMSDYGLLPALPVTWFVGVALLLGGITAALCRRRADGGLLAVTVLALVVALFGTVPAVSSTPQYFWVYKHIGVTRYIELHGSVNPGIDIYHRWPGFFAVSALFSRLAGRDNPVDYAGWAEVFFAAAGAVLVAALGRRLLRDTRLAWLAAVLFVLGNWVGQSYFAPQAFAFTLTLAMWVLLFDHFCEPRSNRLQRIVLRGLGVVARRPLRLGTLQPGALCLGTLRPGPPPGEARHPAGPSRPPRWAVVVLLLVLLFAVVASHQLTPYMFLIGVAGLALLGLMRPWWLVAVMTAVTVGYLVPNLGFVQDSFGLFTGVDPLDNLRTTAAITTHPLPGKQFNGLTGQVLTAGLLLLAVVGAVRWLRRGDGRALVPIVLVLASGALIVGQNYGGEGILRVALFALPWAAILGARALAPVGAGWRPRRAALVLPVFAALAALFLPAFYGQAKLNILPADEVSAAEYLYDHGTAGTPIVLAATDFPVNLAGTYDRFPPREQNVPSLLDRPELLHRPLGPADVADAMRMMGWYGRDGYLVFSATQEAHADIYQLAPPGALRSLEHALVESGHFRLWHATEHARIYYYRAPAS